METATPTFIEEFLRPVVTASHRKPKLYDTNHISQTLLGRPEIENYRITNVDLIPKEYFDERLIFTKKFETIEEENQWLKRSQQQNRKIFDPENPKQVYYISTTISEEFLKTLNLPTGKALRLDIDLFEQMRFKGYDRRYKFKNLAERMLNAYLYKWTYFSHVYWQLYMRADVVEFCSRKHALLFELLAIEKEFAIELCYLHKIYNQIAALFFKKISLDRFYRIIRPIRREPDLAHLAIGHGSLDKHKENIKFSYEARLLAFNEACYRNKKAPDVLPIVNAFLKSQRNDNTVEIKLRTLQNFLSIPMVKNLIFIRRYQSDIDTRDYLLPFIERRRCSRANMQWQMDTFDVPIACLPFQIGFVERSKFSVDLENEKEHSKKSGTKVKCCIVTDNMSGMIIGYACSYSENRWLQIAALRMAVYFTKTVCFELVTDNHSGYSTPEFLRIIDLLTSFGCRYRQCEVQRPQDKSVVERTILNLHSIFRSFSGYTGHSVLSRRRDSHMAEDYKKASFKAVHLRDIDAVIAMIPEVMSLYANHSFGGKPTPKQLYESSLPLEGRTLADWKISKMFHKSKHIDHVSGSKVRFIDGQKFIYHIYQPKGQLSVNGRSVILRYDPFDSASAYIFDATTDVYLCQASRFSLVGAIPEDMELDDINMKKSHNANNSRSKAYFSRLHKEAEKDCKDELDEVDFVMPKRTVDEVYSATIADEYIQTHGLYSKPIKEVKPILQTAAEMKSVERKTDTDVQVSYKAHKVLEEIDIDF